MSLPSTPPRLDAALRSVARRYLLPANATAFVHERQASSSTALAMAIERGREIVARGEVPDPALEHVFLQALAALIHEAMRPESGDPAFQAMVLRHRHAHVREYASLSAHAARDRRRVHAGVNAIAHPAKRQRMPAGPEREALAQLHAAASCGRWSELWVALQRLAVRGEANDSSLARNAARLLEAPALDHLRRLDALASDELVRRYQSLWDGHGPRSGSATAAARGLVSHRRGKTVEASATRALEALASRLNEEEGAQSSYRVVTSMRVPPSIPASLERAKAEWDAVLLRQAGTVDASPAWDVCLLVEAKASVDAATTDLPRLLRGLRLLAHAEENAVYPFETRQGEVRLRGASLRTLSTDETSLARTVLYCCDAPAEAAPRLLSAASRMQLLSAQPCLAFASALAQRHRADPLGLRPVWNDLLESTRWRGVLHQYPMLRQVRELMVHVEDLQAAAMPADFG